MAGTAYPRALLDGACHDGMTVAVSLAIPRSLRAAEAAPLPKQDVAGRVLSPAPPLSSVLGVAPDAAPPRRQAVRPLTLKLGRRGWGRFSGR